MKFLLWQEEDCELSWKQSDISIRRDKNETIYFEGLNAKGLGQVSTKIFAETQQNPSY